MCHGNHGNYFYNYYPASVSVNVDSNELPATDDVPFDLTDGVGGSTNSAYGYSPTYYTLSQIVVSAVSGNSGDQFSLDLSGTELELADGAVSYRGVVIATVTGGVDGTPLTITPANGAGYGPAYYTQLMTLIDSVRYVNDSDSAPFSRVVNILVDFADTSDRSFDVTVSVENGATMPELNLFSIEHETLAAQESDALVNTYTTNTQYYASVASQADGTTMIVWSSYGQDGSDYGVYGQLFDSAGAKVGAEFRVSTSTTSRQSLPEVTALDEGGFTVAWTSNHSGSYQVFVQRYGSDGSALGAETLVGGAYSGDQISVIDLAGGGFAVGWRGSGTSGDALFVQRFDASGVSVGSPILISDSAGSDYQLALTPLGEGFAASYFAYNSTLGYYEVYLARFDSTGAAIGAAVAVTSSSNVNSTAVAELADGSLVITWREYSSTTASYDVMARLYGADGNAEGPAFRVESLVANLDGEPAVLALSDGGFAISWYGQSGNDSDVFIRTFDSTGSPTSGQVNVNSTAPGYQYVRSQHALSELPDGSILVAFDGGNEIYTRLISRGELSLTNSGAEVAIPLALAWSDWHDGSETLELTLTGFPEGATFNMGEAGPSGSWIIDVGDPAALMDLILYAPPAYTGQFNLSASATSLEAANGTSATSETLTFVVVVTSFDSAASGTLGVSGTAEEGGSLTASLNSVSDPDGAISATTYQWQMLVDGIWTDIAGAGSATLGIPSDQSYAGQQVRVLATTTDAQGGATVFTGEAQAIANVDDEATGTLGVAGTSEEGATLTADLSGVSDEDGTASTGYQWQILVEGTWTDIVGADGAILSIPADQSYVGRDVRVVATTTDTLGGMTVFTGDTVTLANVEDEATGTLGVTGDAVEGGTLTAELSAVSDEDGSATTAYRWQMLVDGLWTDIAGENGASLNVPADQSWIGREVRVVATTTDALGGTTEFAGDSQTIANVNDAPDTPADSDPAGDSSGTDGVVAEDALVGTVAGVTASAFDLDGDAVSYSFGLDGGGQPVLTSGPFAIDPDSGAITLSGPVDFETQASYTLNVRASDGTASSTADFVIAVTNATPASPSDSDDSANSLAEDAPAGTYAGITLSSSDPNGGTVTYSIVETGSPFAIETVEGTSRVVVAGELDYETAAVDGSGNRYYDVTVAASDGEDSSESVFRVFVSDIPEVAYVFTSGNDGSAISPIDLNTTLVADDARYSSLGGDDFVILPDGASSEGWDYGQTFDAGNGNDFIQGGTEADRIAGGGGNDALFGGSGNDVIDGGRGNDLLLSGAGADFLIGGLGKDLFVFSDSELGSNAAAGNHDVIADFRANQDKIDLSALYSSHASGRVVQGSIDGVATISDYGILIYKSEGRFFVAGDTDGVAGADFTIEVQGTLRLSARDLVLTEVEFSGLRGNVFDYAEVHRDYFFA